MYPHFDVENTDKSICIKIADPNYIKKHRFYPFIRRITVAGWRKNDAGKYKVKERHIMFGSHLDSHIYEYYSGLVGELYESYIKDLPCNSSIIGYRRIRVNENAGNNIVFAANLFSQIQNLKSGTLLCFDVLSFFDNIKHDILKEKWIQIINKQGLSLPKDHFQIFKSITNYSYVELKALRNRFNGFYEMDRHSKAGKRICNHAEFLKMSESKLIKKNNHARGIPQGSPISALLANIYMIDFDVRMYDFVVQLGGFYYRYSDDIAIFIPTEHVCDTKEEVTKNLKNLELKYQDNKTEQTEFTCGQVSNDSKSMFCQYLGFEYDGKEVRIRSSTKAKFYNRLPSRVFKYGIVLDIHNVGNLRKCLILNKFHHKRKSNKAEKNHKGSNFISYIEKSIGIFETYKIDCGPIKKLSHNNKARIIDYLKKSQIR